MKFFLNIINKIKIKFYGVPSKKYLRYRYKNGHTVTYKIDFIVGQYLQGGSLESISKDHNKTRERIRQILIKASVCSTSRYNWLTRRTNEKEV